MNWYGGDSYPERNPKTVYGVGLPKPKPMGAWPEPGVLIPRSIRNIAATGYRRGTS